MVTKSILRSLVRPGRFAPALLLMATGSAPLAQGVAPPPSNVPAPDQLEMSKLIWSIMAAVDHANISGNYSVLRDMSAPGFQSLNDNARLTQIFSGLRASGTDLSNALLLAPTYRAPPQFVQRDVFRIQGAFLLRPTSISFDLHFQWIAGRWRLFGVAISPLAIASEQPGPPQAPKAPPAPQKR